MSLFIKLDDIKKFPIRKNHYDKANGNEHFIYGIETVMEYIDELPTYDLPDINLVESYKEEPVEKTDKTSELISILKRDMDLLTKTRTEVIIRNDIAETVKYLNSIKNKIDE